MCADGFPTSRRAIECYLRSECCNICTDVQLIDSCLSQYPAKTCLVILDSDHSKSHVRAELNIFAAWVSVGSYMIVEDTNLNGHPTYATFGEGPFEAVQEFLAVNANFISDRSKEKFLMTFNPRGYLRRIS